MKTTAKRIGFVLVAAMAAGTAFAASHSMEQQKARSALMKTMGQNLGILGKMAKGEMDFDASAAATAAAALHEAAVKAVAQEMWDADVNADTNPESRALPAIWENPDDFAAKQAALVKATEGAQGAAGESLQALQASMAALGGACGECHKVYRKPE